MGSRKRVQRLGQLLPVSLLCQSFRSLAQIAEFLGSNRPRKPLELMENLARVVVARAAKRAQTLDEPPAILYGLADQGAQIFGVIRKQRLELTETKNLRRYASPWPNKVRLSARPSCRCPADRARSGGAGTIPLHGDRRAVPRRTRQFVEDAHALAREQPLRNILPLFEAELTCEVDACQLPHERNSAIRDPNWTARREEEQCFAERA